MTDGQTAVGMGGWMKVIIVYFGTTLYSMCTSINGGMLPLPTLHRRKYLFYRSILSEVTHVFFKVLYCNIIRDIDVSL